MSAEREQMFGHRPLASRLSA